MIGYAKAGELLTQAFLNECPPSVGQGSGRVSGGEFHNHSREILHGIPLPHVAAGHDVQSVP